MKKYIGVLYNLTPTANSIHCFLILEDGTWPEEAYSLVADITKGALIYTQVADYTDAGVPLVLCYVVVGPQVRNIFLLTYMSGIFSICYFK